MTSAARLLGLVRDCVAETRLDLSGQVVLTEAASGAYVVTPVIAAVAGARRVLAFCRDSSYGTVSEVERQTVELATLAGVADRIEVVTALTSELLADVSVVTNSGHLRPLDEAILGMVSRGAVVPLMYEAWELATRPTDVDLSAADACGIRVAGTNERHPAVDVFSYLPWMAARALLDAGVAIYRSRIAVLCDNEFDSYLAKGLQAAGATVTTSEVVAGLPPGRLDAIVVALRPRAEDVLTAADAAAIAERWPGAIVLQFWGDLPRAAFAAASVSIVPPREPARGHMGVLPSAVGPEPVVRLQTGGLKVAQALLADEPSFEETRYVDAL